MSTDVHDYGCGVAMFRPPPSDSGLWRRRLRGRFLPSSGSIGLAGDAHVHDFDRRRALPISTGRWCVSWQTVGNQSPRVSISNSLSDRRISGVSTPSVAVLICDRNRRTSFSIASIRPIVSSWNECSCWQCCQTSILPCSNDLFNPGGDSVELVGGPTYPVSGCVEGAVHPDDVNNVKKDIAKQRGWRCLTVGFPFERPFDRCLVQSIVYLFGNDQSQQAPAATSPVPFLQSPARNADTCVRMATARADTCSTIPDRITKLVGRFVPHDWR